MTYVSSTVPLTNSTGAALRFDLGTVGSGACGAFMIYVQVDSSVLLGQTHCTHAHIYPDSNCASTWQGANLEVDGTCLSNKIAFTIRNTAASMSQVTNYFVFEDNIMMRQGTVQLGGGTGQIINQPILAGKTYRIAVEQENGFPDYLGDTITTTALEGCKALPDGSFSTGFVTQFPNGDGAPFRSTDCQQNRVGSAASYKTAQPSGYDPAYHYIEQNTALHYHIRFQNVGSDTASLVIVLDTLSSFLDVSSLEMGASSHPYTWSIVRGNVLRVVFSGVAIPDSSENEPLSHGFFRYRIQQHTDNPVGSVVYNTAAVYVNHRSPVFTNTTFHTIEEDFLHIQVVDPEILSERLQLVVQPNPFQRQTTFSIRNHLYQHLRVQLYTITGIPVGEAEGQGNELQLDVSKFQLSAGVYIYRLEGDGEHLATGKVVVR